MNIISTNIAVFITRYLLVKVTCGVVTIYYMFQSVLSKFNRTGVQKLTGVNLKVVFAKFSTLS